MSIKVDLKESNINFNEICRLCFRKSSDFINIFSQSKNNSRHIAYMIMTCTSVQVSENDGLPQQICKKCGVILNIAFDFKIECEETDEKLRQFIKIESSNQEEDVNESKPVIQFQFEQIYFNSDTNSGINLKIIAINDTDQSRAQNREVSSNETNSLLLNNLTKSSSDNLYNNENIKERNKISKVKSKKVITKRKALNNTSHRVLEVNEEDGSIRRVYQCDICGKTFNRREYLTQHTRIHTGEKPYHCHLCEKRFINSGHLTTHMRTHTGVKPHQCHLCPKAFSTKQELTKHTMVHNGDRPFQCNVCNKKFGSSSNMYTHLKHHTGEKNFTCEHCGKPFYTKQELKQHFVIHTGERAFVCDVCKKRFAQIAHLRRHSKVHK